MINLLLQNSNSIPFKLQKDVVAGIDSISANDFLSYQYLPLDSSKMFYDIEAISQKMVFLGIEGIEGIEGLAHPFMQQIGGVLFLVFTVLFALFALVFSNSGLSYFGNILKVFSFDRRNKKKDNPSITTIDAWSRIFYVFQTYLLYSILFFDIAIQNSNQYYSNYDYIVLFSQIFAGILLFTSLKYLFYRFVGNVFSESKMSVLINTYLSVIYLTGILSFLPIVAYIYIPEVKLYVLFLLLAVFIFGRLAVFIQSFVFFSKVHIGRLYFFVYLCAIEIMPYLLLYKAIVLIS